jgi:hypothetical protein
MAEKVGGIMSKDPNYAVKIEQAIAKKYGEEASKIQRKLGPKRKMKNTLLN